MSLSNFLSSELFLPALLGGAVFIAIMGIWVGLIEDDSAEKRVKMLEKRRADLREFSMQGRGSRHQEAVQAAKGIVERFKLLPSDAAKGTANELAQAGFRSRDAVFIYTFIRLVMPLIGLGIGAFIFFVLRLWDTTSSNMTAASLGFFIAFGLVPSVVLNNLKQRRLQSLSKSIPDALDLFVICAEAGLSLDATFERVSNEIAEAHPDLADEFGITSVELGFMPERAKALQALSERCPLPAVRSLVSTLVQTERYGTPLATAMRVLSVEMRNERMMRAEEKAARLPAVMTVPMILFILPPLFVVLIGPAILRAKDAFK